MRLVERVAVHCVATSGRTRWQCALYLRLLRDRKVPCAGTRRKGKKGLCLVCRPRCTALRPHPFQPSLTVRPPCITVRCNRCHARTHTRAYIHCWAERVTRGNRATLSRRWASDPFSSFTFLVGVYRPTTKRTNVASRAMLYNYSVNEFRNFALFNKTLRLSCQQWAFSVCHVFNEMG